MPLTVPDVVRALRDAAPREAKLWLSGMLLAMEAIISAPEAPAVHQALDLGPFHSLDDVRAARTMLSVGASGRQIAEDFDLPLGVVAEWVQRQRPQVPA